MASSFAKDALKVCVAQICQNIGWHAVQASPMDILVDVMQRYVFEIAKSVHQYSIQYNRTEPNLDDLALTFKDFGIVLQEIEEYVNNVEPVPFAHKIASFPVKHPPNLQHPKPESRELLVRPEHIPEYLPLMRPDLEEEDVFNQQNTVDGVKKTTADAGGDSPSPFSSPKHGSRRSGDWAPDTPNKKPRYYSEEEGRPMREVTSVFMTAAGFISPVHEGKTADSSLPCLVDSPPPTPEFPSPSHSVTPAKKDSKSKDVKKEKGSKPKRDKDGKKDIKKVKSSKKEKENKENAVSKHDKAMTATSSSSIKKEHGSHKSSKSEKSSKFDDSRHPKVKSDKAKVKGRKDELHKIKDGLKFIKLKAKMKHTGGSSSSLKPSKLSSSKKFKSARLPKPFKNFKSDKVKTQVSPVKSSPPVPVVPKEPPVEIKVPVVEPVVEKIMKEEPIDTEDLSFREESPESRLVIDDSLETQARQERESRLEVIDECIEAVIRQGEKESEVEAEKTHKAMDETINAVIRGPPMKKLEPKDIYDFTDASDDSSISSCDIPLPPQSPILPPKKEKKTPESKKSSESPKKNKNKEKHRKKGGKEPKAKSPSPFSPPKSQKTQFVLKVDDRTPSPPPTLKDDLLSSDSTATTPSSTPPHNAFLELSPQRQGHMHPSSLLSHISSPLSSSFIPMPIAGPGYSTNPFTPMRSLPSHMQTHFPTPPLFEKPAKTESNTSFQNMQPLNLAKSGPSSVKSSPDKSFELSSKVENSDLIKKAVNLIEKPKPKEKKEKVKKKGKKETDKAKEKKEKEESKEREKVKPKEKPKAKTEKNVKVDKRKSKPEKKKIKEKEEKAKEDSSVPKITMKLTSGTGSTKISLVKPNTKNSTPLSSSPSSSHDEDEMLPTPSPPPHVPSPSPQREPTPPPPPSPSPPPPPVKEPKEMTPPPVPPPPISKTPSSRGRGRGKKAAVQAIPPARTVITETVGTIVDESGNKIWICPACSGADDGSPMIGCDECDDWYHWVCVGIVVPPKEEENWFCVRCIAKRQTPAVKRRRKKHKKDK